MPSKTPDQLIDTMRTFFVPNYAPTTVLGNMSSLYLSLPGLRSFYPMGVNRSTGAGAFYLTDIANGFDLLATAPVSTMPQIKRDGILSYMNFANTAYATYGADNAHFDILGTEANMYTGLMGLTMGGWFRPATLASATQGVVSKYGAAGQRAYLLYISTTNVFSIAVSQDGTNQTLKNSTVALSTGVWYFVVARWAPQAAGENDILSISVNLTEDTVAQSYTALFNSTQPFMLGSSAGAPANSYSGDMAQVFLCAAYVPNIFIQTIYHHTRALFGV